MDALWAEGTRGRLRQLLCHRTLRWLRSGRGTKRG
jgi:hypothetical protein